ncbi:MAG: ubiquinone biosynthesis protein UbiE [Chloroflexi bacterium RBG_13_52_14]|nr:MAG: ubiquinone biosynthesis protein UbiE [Chloroflexi bacterium RBG_13_52_14]
MNHREYFNQLAVRWNHITSEETKARLPSLIKELKIEPGETILDIGSGTGILLPLLHEATNGEGKIVSLDIAEEMLKQAKNNGHNEDVDYVQADVAAIPFPDNTFDLIICYSCFPHFPDKTKALVEIARVLRNGGRLAICHTASRQEINELHHSIGGVIKHDTIPDGATMREMLKASGLKPIEIVDKKHRYLAIASKG